MKRLFDIALSIWLFEFLALPMMIIAAVVAITSRGSILYWSTRVGRNNVLFKMPKFRTMEVHAPTVATHLLGKPELYYTPIGKFLRKTSLDELPQLWSILIGDMSFVGPRPALFNQYDLIELRTQKGIHVLVPGLTGWAQVNGRDKLPIPVKVDFDDYYLHNKSFMFDMEILFMTISKSICGEGINH